MTTKPMGDGRIPPSNFFKVLMGSFKTNLSLPKAFIENFNGNVPKKISLESPTGISWMVSVQQDDDEDFWLRDEWEAFAKGHGLEMGDFLVFRWTAWSEFHVKIFGKNCCEKELPLPDVALNEGQGEELSKTGIQLECPLKSKADEAAAAKNMTMPNQISVGVSNSFTCIIQHYNRYAVHFPKRFAKEKALAEKDGVVLLDPSGKSWTVKLNHRSEGRTSLGSGWLEFFVENKLNTSDTCSFKFLQGADSVIAVAISRKNTHEVGEIAEDNAQVEMEAEGSASDNPTFSVTMRPTYVERVFYLALPRSFVKIYMKNSPHDITLRASNGDTWTVRYNPGKRATLGKGWKAFVKANNLKEDDLCTFELVDRDNIVMKVSISRV